MNPSPPASSMKENRKKLENLTEKMNFIEEVRSILIVLILVIPAFCMILFSVQVYGMSLYPYLLAFHALSFSCLSIVHHRLLIPLIDEYNIIVCKIDGQRYHQPTHMSKKVLFWGYYLPYFLTNAGTWKYLSYMDFQEAEPGSDELHRQIGIGVLSALFLFFVSLYVVWLLDVLYSELKIERKQDIHESEQRNESVDKKVSLQLLDLLGDVKAENTKLRQELAEKEKENIKLTHELMTKG